MPKLEALVIQRANDYREMIRDPVYQNFVRDFVRELVNNIKRTVFKAGDPQEEEIINQYLNPDTICDGMLKDETKLRENAYQNARTQFIVSRADAESMVNVQTRMEQVEKESPEIAAAFKPLMDKFFTALESQYQFNAALVTELARIAKERGLEQAVLREMVNKTIRKLIPTAEAYLTHRQKTTDSVAEFLAGIQKVFASFAGDEGEEEDEEMRMIGTMFSSISQSLSTKLLKDSLKREAQRFTGD